MRQRPTALLIGNFPPPFGGIPTHLASFAPYLADQGWRVHILSLKYRRTPARPSGDVQVHDPQPRNRVAKAATLLAAGPQLWRTPGAQHMGLWEAYRLADLWSIARNLHRTTPLAAVAAYHVLPSGVLASWLHHRFGVPYATTVFGEFFSDQRLVGDLAPLARRVLSQSAARLSCSRHCAASVQRCGFTGPVDTLYYGINTSLFAPGDARAARAALDLPTEGTWLAFVGRFDEEMGVRVALETWQHLRRTRPHLRLLLAGRAGGLSAMLAATAAREHGMLQVRTDVPSAQLPDVYRAADVVLVPSLNARACLGLAVAEAMACARPTVVSSAGGGPEVCTDGRTGLLVPAGDVAATADAAGRLLDDPDVRRRFGEAGRAAAIARFDEQATNRAMADVLLSLRR